MKENPRLKKALLDAVEEQLKSPDTPYVKEHYERLIGEGISQSEAKRMIGCILTVELWEMNKFNRAFDEDTYIQRLADLPDESYLDEE